MARNSSSSCFYKSVSNSSSHSKKKDKPFCTHCGLTGHTVDRCYKLHGYPPGYRTSGSRNNSSQNKSATDSSKPIDSSTSSNLPDSLTSLSVDQCQGLLFLLQSHLTKVNSGPTADSVQSHVAGQVLFEDDWQS
ncbi:uncharacterized protein LOC111018505 [Momordica charantia]|uniref:Uncharacterized protein LOC111018505 n=1 Tax=Momordica charantia TaxID=3673 RepID=A0A6J1D849_MOMCH|nr:uncharacterized protein LOC111018505 [Momordica charantia]